MDLSVVVPVYNEDQKIRQDILAASAYLSGCGWSGEIIVVDDGSDDRTAEVATDTPVDERIVLKVIRYEEHKGKGHAVKKGILEAVSDLVLFIDSGNCVPYGNITRGIDLLKDGACEMAHGSRFLSGSLITRPRTAIRKGVSYGFRKYIRLFSRIPRHLTDTQCGLKIYRKEVAHELYGACITDGFLFDIEIILRSQKKGYRILEFPIEWTSDPDSRLSVNNTFGKTLAELRTIRRALQ
jgi:dolichyl-phosphate beta-glucosyltransferase